jgi:type I restriction enzyme R subunit
LKWAKPKVRKMIDAHLETLGIDSRVAPISLLSKDFAKEVGKLGKNSKSKASEMEHAIRRHIKVNINKDPALYKRFLKRMEEIIERYQGNWDAIVEEFEKVREDLAKGRKGENEEEGLNEQELPFYDFIMFSAFKDEAITQEEKEVLKALTVELVHLLKDAINKPNFWKGRPAEIRKLQGEVEDLISFAEADRVSKIHAKLSVELMNLAKRRHQELTK